MDHPLRPLMDGLGVCQSWIDRMLQTVSVLKQNLENGQQVRSLFNSRS